jgi:Sulfotransferase domain
MLAANILDPAPAGQGLNSPNPTSFHTSIRKNDVFLCGYPKSGTTWLGFLIAHATKKDPNEQLDLKTLGKHVPDVNVPYTNGTSLAKYSSLTDPRFFVCNAAFDPHLSKVVYIVRDPRDTMVSCWHYQKYLNAQYGMSLADFLRSKEHIPCEWDEHVSGWMLPQTHPAMLVVRYEEIHKDAAAVLRRVLEFAGVKGISDTRNDAAVEASRFERMRAAEHKGESKAGDRNERLVRKGRVGSWQEEMGYTELRIIEERYGKVMRQVGYEPLS